MAGPKSEINLDINDKDYHKAIDNAIKKAKAFGQSGEKASEEFTGSVKDLADEVENMGGKFKSVGSIKDFMGGKMDEVKNTSASVIQLNKNITETGKTGKDTSKVLQDWNTILDKTEGLTSEAAKEQDGLNKKLQKGADHLDDTTKAAQGSTGATKQFGGTVASSAGSIIGNLKGIAAAAGAVYGVVLALGAVKDFLGVGFTGAVDAESKLIRLNNALKITGQYTKETSADLDAWSAEMEASTLVSAEAVQRQLALAISMGQSADGAKELTQAALDLSYVTGESLDGSMKKLQETLQGSAGELANKIPGWKDLTEAQLRNGEAVRLVARLYGGEAAKAADTFEGKQLKLKNTYENSAKAFGKSVVENVAVRKSIEGLVTTFENVKTAIETNGTAINTFLTGSLAPLNWALSKINEIIEKGNKKRQDEISGLTKVKGDYERYTSAVTQAEKELDRLTKQADKFKQSYPFDTGGQAMQTSIVATAQAEVDRLKSLQAEAEKLMVAKENLAKWRAGDSLGGSAPSKPAGGGLVTNPKAIADDTVDNSETIGAIQAESEAREIAYQQELVRKSNWINLNQTFAEKELEWGMRLEEFDYGTEERKRAQFENDVALFGEADAIQLQLLESKRAKAEEEKRFNDETALNAEINEKRKAAASKARIDLEIQQEQAKKAALMGILSNTATLMQSSNRKAFEAGKAAAITQAVISTYLGATQAFTSLSSIPIVGPALGAVAAAAAVASGMMQVDKIRSQQMPKAQDGGYLTSNGGISYTGDKGAFMGNVGEVILNPREQSVVKSVVGEGGMGNPIVINLLNRIADSINTPPAVYLGPTKVSSEVSYQQDRVYGVA